MASKLMVEQSVNGPQVAIDDSALPSLTIFSDSNVSILLGVGLLRFLGTRIFEALI